MTSRDRAARAARQVWGAVRARVPGAQAALGVAREGARSPAGRARQAADLARRVHELERDQALIAAQLAAVQASSGTTEPASRELVERLVAARLEAVALYEHRIGELERRVLRRRDTPARLGTGETTGEFSVRPS